MYSPPVRRLIFALGSALLTTPLAFDVNANVTTGADFAPLPMTVQVDPKRARLGEQLFHDPRLSGDGTVSCASCHVLELGGHDGRQVSVGIGGALGKRNAPTVWNAAFNFRQFWDGRAENLQAQVEGPIHDPVEMGTTWARIVSTLQGDNRLVAAFNAAYGRGPDPKSISDAIATFEQTLTTPDSRFDRFLRGDESQLSELEREGLELFTTYGCSACHQGMNVGGNMYQRFGVMNDYYANHENETQVAAASARTKTAAPSGAKPDLGRYLVTGKDRDRYRFKVPSLRNVALTAPYFHDGSIKTLEQAVEIMASYQLGMPVAEEEITAIVAFLKTLTGARFLR